MPISRVCKCQAMRSAICYRDVVKYFAAALAKSPRQMLVHGLFMPVDDQNIKALKSLVYDIQPVFVGTDLHIVEQRIGKTMQTTYAWKTMQVGIPTAGGSIAVEM